MSSSKVVLSNGLENGRCRAFDKRWELLESRRRETLRKSNSGKRRAIESIDRLQVTNQMLG